jgi:hypothetical protein
MEQRGRGGHITLRRQPINEVSDKAVNAARMLRHDNGGEWPLPFRYADPRGHRATVND